MPRPAGSEVTVGGKVPAKLGERVQRIARARDMSVQKWLRGMLERWVPEEEIALGIRRRRPRQRHPLRELPPFDQTRERPATPSSGPAAASR